MPTTKPPRGAFKKGAGVGTSYLKTEKETRPKTWSMDKRREMQNSSVNRSAVLQPSQEGTLPPLPNSSSVGALPVLPTSEMRYKKAKLVYGNDIRNRFKGVKRKDAK